MGVDRYDYLMVGWKLDVDKTLEHDDWDIDLMYDEFPDSIIYDGMSGEYAFYGKIIAQADDKYEGFTLTELKPESLILTVDEIREFREDFKKLGVGELLDCVEDQTPKTFIFSHFS
jgi:hypothetical protein